MSPALVMHHFRSKEGLRRAGGAMCQLARSMFAAADSLFRTPEDLEATVALVVAFSLGATVLESQVARHLGGTHLLDPAVLPRYSLASMELFTHGLFTDDTFLRQIRAAFTPVDDPARRPADGVTDPDPPAAP